MEQKIEVVRIDYGMRVYGVWYDNGRDGGYVELRRGEEPTFDRILEAILSEEWPLARRMNLADMQRYRPDDVDTVKATNAYSFDFDIAVTAAKQLMADWHDAHAE